MKKLTCKKLCIDFSSQKISIGDNSVKLDPKAFKTLKHLVNKRHRIVTSDELIKVVWDDRQISNDVVISAIGRIRKLFKNANIEHETIHTVHKVGYQFTLEDFVLDSQLDGENQPIHPSRFHQKLNWILIFILIIFGVFFFYSNVTEQPKSNVSQANNQTFIRSAQLKDSNSLTEIFFLRHADKTSDEEENPHLSELGIYRSKQWQQFFQHINFDEVYTTNYYRNTETASLVLGNSKKKISLYSPLSFNILKHLNKIRGKKILIIGHSNTIPDMLNRLVGYNQYEPMSHKNYDYIYQVYIGVNGDISSNLFYFSVQEHLFDDKKFAELSIKKNE